MTDCTMHSTLSVVDILIISLLLREGVDMKYRFDLSKFTGYPDQYECIGDEIMLVTNLRVLGADCLTSIRLAALTNVQVDSSWRLILISMGVVTQHGWIRRDVAPIILGLIDENGEMANSETFCVREEA